jgi:hypothetical protein
MTPDIPLHRKLNEATRRIRLLLVYQWAARLLCWTALACVLLVIASRLRWVQEPEPAVLAGAMGAAALVGAAIGFSRRLTRMDVARLTDSRTGLKDRLATAVEFEGAAEGDPLVRHLVDDAGQRAKELNLRRVYPWRVTREGAGFVAFALVLFGAFFLPTLPAFRSKEQKAEAAEVKKHGQAIEKLAIERQKAAEGKKLDETAKAAAEARKLAEAMRKGDVSKKAAMVKLAKLTKKMEEQQKRMAMANTPGRKSMEEAGKEIQKALEQQQKAITEAARAAEQKDAKADGKHAAQKPGEKPNAQGADGKTAGEKDKRAAEKAAQQAQQAGSQSQQSEAMKKAQQAMQKFAQALMDQSGEQQNAAMQDLAKQLESGQLNKQEMDQLQKQMQQAANAMKGTDLDKAAKEMEKAAQELAKLMKEMNITPEDLKKLAQMVQQAGGT